MITLPRPATGTILALDGDLPSGTFITALRESRTALVAADGAALRLRALGIRADVVVGDLDGIADARRELERDGTIVVERPDQESGDLEKALLWIQARGETRVDIIGISGGMTDHILGNFSVIARYAGQLSISALQEAATIWFTAGHLAIETSAGDRISLLPLPSARLTTSGLEWELRDELLAIAGREGGSNRATSTRVTIDVAGGIVGVMHYRNAFAGQAIFPW